MQLPNPGLAINVQIRSHAQKYFQKQVKNGNSAAVLPPRPKRQVCCTFQRKLPATACYSHCCCRMG